ncbi:MAG: zinc ABC transporter substrate-binding protein [Clostridia bacterium]|nr:zinc ABC transporter substrate-binding protein [Clostridia bacterium]
MHKRTISAILAIVLLLPVLFALGSCGITAPNGDKPMVVTTIFPPYDFAREVAEDRIDLSVLVTVTDSHSFSPTAADMAKIEECDLFIYTGGDGDVWAEDFLKQIDTSDKTVINMMELCTLLESEHEHEHAHGHDHEHDHEEETYDEHVWLDPHNAILIVEAIRDALCAIDPSGETDYRTNADSYLAELGALDEDYHITVSSAKQRSIVVADQFPYRYLCEAYGIEYASAIDGCGSASDLTAIEYENLAEKLREGNLSVILCTEYSDRTIAKTVLRESNREDVQILSLHSCHTLTKSAIREGQTYLSLMRENLGVLSEALN